MDRIETQEEIQVLIQNVFGDKKRINYDDYVKLNQEVTSEMFLSILTLLQTNIPCSVNFYRYKNNYEKYLDDGNGSSGTVTVKQLSSPRFMQRLSPIRDLAKTQGLLSRGCPNPEAQNGLLKYAMNRAQQAKSNQEEANEDSDEDLDVSKFESKKKMLDEKSKRKLEIEALKKQGADQIMSVQAEATRQPNFISKGTNIDPITGTAKLGKDADVFQSPSCFLQGASPRMSNFMASGEDECIQFEGEMIRKATETKLKKYWYCLLGKELYVYKNKAEEKHKGMHNLVGVFIKDDPEEHLDE